MPKSKAEGREKWTLMTAKPEDPTAVTLDELGDGMDISCAIAASDSRISATGSATFSDPAVCDEIAVQDFGASNYEGNVAPFRYYDEEGVSEPGSDGDVRDSAFKALAAKGTLCYIAIRETSKLSTEAWAEDDARDDQWGATGSETAGR